MNVFWKIIGTSLGSGYSPFAPGTMGAIVGIIIVFLLPESPFLGFTHHDSYQTIPLFLLIILFFFLGVIATNKLEKEWGHDPQKIVLDETVGVWITVFLFPITWQILLAGFILFRIFDIWKPLGIRKAEQLPGGWGVMMDDVLAGIYGAITLLILIQITPSEWWLS